MFVLVVLTVLTLIHLYLWRRLVVSTGAGRTLRRVVGYALPLLAASTVAALAIGDRLPQTWERVVAWPGLVWLGVMFYLLVTLLALELPVLLAGLGLRVADRRRARRAAGRGGQVDRTTAAVAATVSAAAGSSADVSPVPSRPAPPADTPPADGGTASPSGPADPPVGDRLPRRVLLRRAAAVTAGLVTVAATGGGLATAYRPPVVRRLEVPLRRLDPRADGLRVAVVADIHLGPLYGGAQLAQVVETVNRLDADLVTLVGDMVTSRIDRIRRDAEPLARMRARYGVYAVTGNHEYFTGHEAWLDAAGDLGLRVLRNERVEIVHRGGALDLAGVNDRVGAGYGDPPDYEAALGDRDPTRPVVLLAHQPVQVHDAAAYGVDLQLSGHTHGGQVFPFHLLVRLQQPVVSGLGEVDGTLVYVTNGAGFWGPPMRVGATPDVTLITLRAL